MSRDTNNDTGNAAFRDLEGKIDQLLILSDQLKRENNSLKEREEGLMKERVALIEKNEMARSKVEGMITRLKALGPEI